MEKLTYDNVKCELNKFEQFMQLFEKENQWKILAKIDLKIIETILLTTPEHEFYQMVMKKDFSEQLSRKITDTYLGEEKARKLSGDIQQGEVPSCFKF